MRNDDHHFNQTYRQIVEGTAILSISSLVAKILSAVYRVPFQNLVGNVGFYTYQQVYPLYGLAVTISLTGMPVFISQVVAKYDDFEDQRAVARRLLLPLWLVGLAMAALLWLLAPQLGQLMGDRPLGLVIRGVAPVFFLAPVIAAARGFRQGRLELMPTAISQLGEQTVRVALVIVVAWLAVNNHWNAYVMGHYAMLASVAGSVTAVVILLPTVKTLLQPGKAQRAPQIHAWRALWTGGGLLCLLAGLMVLLQLVDAFTVKKALVNAGLSPLAARSLKGVFDRAQPLVQLGLVIANSFIALLMPGLSRAQREQSDRQYWRLYDMMVHYCLVISFLAAGGLVALMPQINELLFKSRAGSMALALEMVAIVLAALINCFASVMQTQGRLKALAGAIFAGLFVKAAVNSWLVTQLKIAGAAVGTILALLVMVVVCYAGMPKRRQNAGRFSFAAKLILVTAIMMTIARVTALGLEALVGTSRVSEILVVAVAVIVGVAVALGLLVVTHLLTAEELTLVPGGSLLNRWGKE